MKEFFFQWKNKAQNPLELSIAVNSFKGNKALKSEILSRSFPHFLISHHDLKILNQNWGSMFGDSKQINWEAGNSNLLFLSNFLEMTYSKFPILRLYYLYLIKNLKEIECSHFMRPLGTIAYALDKILSFSFLSLTSFSHGTLHLRFGIISLQWTLEMYYTKF